MLARTVTGALTTTGFDPYRGFYHQPRYGRPALALDMMEPFRPLLADSSVIQAINNGEVRPTDFVGGAGRVNLRSEEHTSELQSLMRISYAVFCLNKKNNTKRCRRHYSLTR